LTFFRQTKSLLKLFIIFLLSSTLLLSKGTKTELIHANRLESYKEGDKLFRRLVGDVKLKRDGVILTCESAESLEEEDITWLYGNVRITLEEGTISGYRAKLDGKKEEISLIGHAQYLHNMQILRSEELIYHLDSKTAIAFGNPFIQDSTRIIQADTLTYSEKEQMGRGFHNIRIMNDDKTMIIKGDQFQYFVKEDSILVSNSAQLMQFGDTDTTFVLIADSLSITDKHFLAWDNVHIHQNDVTGQCDVFDYLPDDSLAVMKGSPFLGGTYYQLSGEFIELRLAKDQIESVFIPSKPQFYQEKTYLDTTFADKITGQKMAIAFEEGFAKEITVLKMATSVYHIIEDSTYQGRNTVSGDTLSIFIENDEPEKIYVYGGAQGTFKPSGETDLDSDIIYKGNFIGFSNAGKLSAISDEASIKYGNMTLSAGNIEIFWQEKLLRARPILDSLHSQSPILEQKNQDPFYGDEMLYDLSTRRGKVTGGRTKSGGGFYQGEDIVRVNEDVYHVQDGIFTTCDLPDHQHFYFESKKMKIIKEKVIISQPLVLVIADVPVMALPFGIFPQKSGRGSGILLPSFEYNTAQGHSLRGLGYYWGINDYVDFVMELDFFDAWPYRDSNGVQQYKSSFQYRPAIRYKKLYRLNGYINASLVPDFSSGENNFRWRVKFNHSQTITPDFSINGGGTLSGDASFAQDFDSEQQNRLDKKLTANMTASKRFEKGSLSIGATYNEDLQAGQRALVTPDLVNQRLAGPQITLPSIGVNHDAIQLFPKAKKGNWVSNLKMTYGSSAYAKKSTSYLSKLDSNDSLYWEAIVKDKHLITHNSGISTSGTVLKYLTVSANITGNEKWVFKADLPEMNEDGFAQIDTSGDLIFSEQNQFLRRATFSTSSSLSTKLYGLFPVNIGNLMAIRHVFTPRISIGYTPDFSSDFWNYIDTYTDSTLTEHNVDLYSRTDMGATPKSEQMSLSYGVTNNIDLKITQNGEIKKTSFFTFAASGSYNFLADSLKASTISGNGFLSLSEKLKLTYNSTLDVYKTDSSGHRINQFSKPRVTKLNFGFSLPLTISKNLIFTVPDTSIDDSSALPETSMPKQSSHFLFKTTMGFSYSMTHSNPFKESNKTLRMNMNSTLKLSPSWTIIHRSSFDLLTKEVVSQNISVNRDLHCWKMTFNWTPYGSYSGWKFLIQVKASQLKDLKLSHSSRNTRF
jgi:lipopolysaccharide assembly outer membrane protein LptD (OstA)